MPYNFLEESDLKDAIADSEAYMRPFFEPLAELERLGRGRPGRIPKGKPRVTDGTLAGVKRETPKRIIQQLPTGRVVIKKNPKLEDLANAVLSDEILLNANSGGTPYAKSKKAIKDTLTGGASAAYCFFNRRGDWFGADFKRVYIKDIGFEKGKVSEFDSNFMFMTGWYTDSDLKAILYWQQELSKRAKDRKDTYNERWDLKNIQAIIDAGLSEKDSENKSEDEKKVAAGTSGYHKIIHAFQIGVGAKFYSYSPQIGKVCQRWTSNDPRGVIPIHLMVPEEDDASPIGEPLLSISAGKQNLLDFDMQMYQYSQGLQYSPPVKKWGDVPTSAVKLVPDAVIDMGAIKGAGTDIEVVDITNSAQRNFAQNYGLLKSQIINEQGGNNDTSISGSVGNPGFSKTDAGVKAQVGRLGISDNDLRKSYESWFGRVCETMLNIHFAESKGKKEIELQSETMKRLKVDPKKPPSINYDDEPGPIKFTVDASTSEAQDSKAENEDLVTLLEITSKYGALPQDRQMIIENQIIKNSGVDDPEKLMYSDDEIAAAKEQVALAQKAATAQAIAATQPQAAQPQPQTPYVDQSGQPVQQLPPQVPQQPAPVQSPPLNDDEVQTIKMLKDRGLPDETIADALTMMRNNVPDDQIAQALQGALNG